MRFAAQSAKVAPVLRILIGGVCSVPLVVAAALGLDSDPVFMLAPLLVLLPLAWAASRVPLTPRVLRLLGLAAIPVAVGLALALSQLMPVSVDGEVYFFQARLLASGNVLTGPLPSPEHFHYYFMVPRPDGAIGGAFPPGWPALLGAMWLVGAPWLLNPLLTGALVALTLTLAHRIAPERPGVAPLAAWLVALSPTLAALGGSYMSHPLAAVLTTAAIVGALKPEGKAPVWVGAVVGLLFIVRPLNGLIVAGVVLAIGLPRRPSPKWVVAGALIGALIGSAYLGYNGKITGDPFKPGQDAWFELTEPNARCHRLGFGIDVGCANAHNRAVAGYDSAQAVDVTTERLTQLGQFGFGPGAALLLPVLLLWRRPDSAVWPLALLGAAQLLTYALFYYHGNFLGPRLLAEAIPALAVLVAMGALTLRWGGVAIALAGLLAGHVNLSVETDTYRWMPYAEVREALEAEKPDKKLVFVDPAGLRGRARWTHYSLAMVLGDVPGP